VLREHEDAHSGPVLGADRLGSAQTFVGVRRWHPDVDDRDVRNVLAGGPEEPICVTNLSDHLETRVDENTSDAFAH
jgi:hypothetical protein